MARGPRSHMTGRVPRGSELAGGGLVTRPFSGLLPATNAAEDIVFRYGVAGEIKVCGVFLRLKVLGREFNSDRAGPRWGQVVRHAQDPRPRERPGRKLPAQVLPAHGYGLRPHP